MCLTLCDATPETAAHQAPPSPGVSRQEHWSGSWQGVWYSLEIPELPARHTPAFIAREGTRASRRVEEGLSRSLSGGGGKPSSLSLFIFMHWRRKWQPTPVLLPGKPCGLRSLVGYSPWGCKELDTTKRLHFTSALLSGNPLQYSCLDHSFQRNPRADLFQNGLLGSPCSPRDSQESSPTPQFKTINSLVYPYPFFIFLDSTCNLWASLVAQTAQNLPAMQET